MSYGLGRWAGPGVFDVGVNHHRARGGHNGVPHAEVRNAEPVSVENPVSGRVGITANRAPESEALHHASDVLAGYSPCLADVSLRNHDRHAAIVRKLGLVILDDALKTKLRCGKQPVMVRDPVDVCEKAAIRCDVPLEPSVRRGVVVDLMLCPAAPALRVPRGVEFLPVEQAASPTSPEQESPPFQRGYGVGQSSPLS